MRTNVTGRTKGLTSVHVGGKTDEKTAQSMGVEVSQKVSLIPVVQQLTWHWDFTEDSVLLLQ